MTTQGEALQEFPLLAMSVTDHVPTELHQHYGYWELVIVSGGAGYHTLENEAFSIGPGDCFVIPPDMLHGYANPVDLALTNILFDPVRLELPERQLFGAPGYRALFQLEPTLRASHGFQSRLRLPREALSRLMESINLMQAEIDSKKPGFEAAGCAHFCLVALELSRNYGDMTAPLPKSLLQLSEIVRWMGTNLARPMTVEGLADRAHMSRSTFMRAFRDCFGVAPMSYVTSLRMEKAAHLLRDGHFQVKEVASAVGIDDTSYFARVFRQRTGMGPSAYRRLNHDERILL